MFWNRFCDSSRKKERDERSMRFRRSKAGLWLVLASLMLVLAVAGLCFLRKRPDAEPDGTLVKAYPYHADSQLAWTMPEKGAGEARQQAADGCCPEKAA